MSNTCIAARWFRFGGRLYAPGDELDGKRKFTRVAEQYAEKHECSMAEAVSHIVKTQPKLHQDFLRTLSPVGKAESGRPPAKHKFMEQAQEHADKHSCSISKAMSHIVRTQPKLHKDFLKFCQAGV